MLGSQSIWLTGNLVSDRPDSPKALFSLCLLPVCLATSVPGSHCVGSSLCPVHSVSISSLSVCVLIKCHGSVLCNHGGACYLAMARLGRLMTMAGLGKCWPLVCLVLSVSGS